MLAAWKAQRGCSPSSRITSQSRAPWMNPDDSQIHMEPHRSQTRQHTLERKNVKGVTLAENSVLSLPMDPWRELSSETDPRY